MPDAVRFAAFAGGISSRFLIAITRFNSLRICAAQVKFAVLGAATREFSWRI